MRYSLPLPVFDLRSVRAFIYFHVGFFLFFDAKIAVAWQPFVYPPNPCTTFVPSVDYTGGGRSDGPQPTIQTLDFRCDLPED